MTSISVLAHPSADIKTLFWETFFVTKSRGVSLERHFPWLGDSSPKSTTFAAFDSRQLVGGLVLRDCEVKVTPVAKVGMIGLVCVRPQSRGNGIAGLLLDAAIARARADQFSDLTLWTNQPDIYASRGFKVADDWLYGWVDARACVNSEIPTDRAPALRWQENTSLPLPPFATKLFVCSAAAAEVVLAKDGEGLIVVKYDGSPLDAASILVALQPRRWRLNARRNDPLLDELTAQGATLALAPSNLQMWLAFRGEEFGRNDVAQQQIAFLNRI